MRPTRFETIGEVLAIVWDDGSESFIPLERLRRACPCAECAGETDLTGRRHLLGQPKSYFATSFQVRGFERVGHYALQPHWLDGHATGIYTFERLRELSDPV